MARKKSDGSGCLIVLVIIISALSSATEWVKTHQELSIQIAGVIIGVLLAKFLWNRYKYKRWISYLNKKYDHDSEIVNAIVNGQFWKGQTSEQLLDSLGNPSAIDRQVLKTKTKETWKYNEIRKDQYALRIMLEKDEVVGWDKKG